MYFKEYLASRLIRHNLTQSSLSEMIGVDSSLVSYWVAGKRKPNHKTLPDIIKIFAYSKEQKKEDLYEIFFEPKQQEKK